MTVTVTVIVIVIVIVVIPQSIPPDLNTVPMRVPSWAPCLLPGTSPWRPIRHLPLVASPTAVRHVRQSQLVRCWYRVYSYGVAYLADVDCEI